MDKFDQGVEDHQIYDDLRQGCQEWLRMNRDKMSSQAETSGDKDDLEGKLYNVKVEDHSFVC